MDIFSSWKSCLEDTKTAIEGLLGLQDIIRDWLDLAPVKIEEMRAFKRLQALVDTPLDDVYRSICDALRETEKGEGEA